MEGLKGATVKTQDGMTGRIVAISHPSGGREPQALIQLENGRQVFFPTGMLGDQGTDGNYMLPVDFSTLEEMEETRGTNLLVIPILSEQMTVNKRRVSTGGVRISKRVDTHTEAIHDHGYEEDVEVDRVPVNKIIEKPAKTRFEGKTMIIPVMEEVLVVEKRLMLKEEVRVTKFRQQLAAPDNVELREEKVTVEKLQPEPMAFDRTKQP